MVVPPDRWLAGVWAAYDAAVPLARARAEPGGTLQRCRGGATAGNRVT
jgi:hypothetical protein